MNLEFFVSQFYQPKGRNGHCQVRGGCTIGGTPKINGHCALHLQSCCGIPISMDIEKVYGEWTVCGKRTGRKVLCECSCGERRDVYVTNLVTGKSLSCGHVRSNATTPEVGEMLYHWKVLSLVNVTTVRAQCSYGAIKDVNFYSIRRGESTSCGHALRTGTGVKPFETLSARSQNPSQRRAAPTESCS